MLRANRFTLLGLPALFLFGSIITIGSQEQTSEEAQYRSTPTAADCSFLNNPEEFDPLAERFHRELSERTDKFDDVLAPILMMSRSSAGDPQRIERRGFVDDHIFGRMDTFNIQPAPLSSDAEFLRRVKLDLTGRIPSAAEVEAFLQSTNPAKRDNLIDSLIGSPEFVDKWTMFFGDLYRVNANSTNVNRFQQGRDAMVAYIKGSLQANKPYNDMAKEMIGGVGESWGNGALNWLVGGTIAMGPVQDTYDGQAVQVAQMFLGLNVADCLLCHDGRRHLESVNQWGATQTRLNMWGLSAFFAQTRMTRTLASQNPQYGYWTITDVNAEYTLNTTTGNRTARQPVNGVNRVAPRYPFTGEAMPNGFTRRQALAEMLTADLQFSRAIVNYVWEELMVQAFVSPSNSFDLARLDPQNPPPEPWTLQPNNPELLKAMAEWFQNNGYDLRKLIALIVKSNAYQLSSEYPGTWKMEYTPFYARHFVRRMDAEEIHDAIVMATGILPRYVITYTGAQMDIPDVSWAMQLPDTREPRTNGTVAQFLNSFGRGDRDQSFREGSGSVLQALNMLNSSVVMQRIHANNAGSHVQRLLASTTSQTRIVQQLFLATVSRLPTSSELATGISTLQRLGNTRGSEALQWALLNKLEFIHNY